MSCWQLERVFVWAHLSPTEAYVPVINLLVAVKLWCSPPAPPKKRVPHCKELLSCLVTTGSSHMFVWIQTTWWVKSASFFSVRVYKCFQTWTLVISKETKQMPMIRILEKHIKCPDHHCCRVWNEGKRKTNLFFSLRNCCVERQRERAAEVGPRREETHRLLFPFKVIAVAHPNNKEWDMDASGGSEFWALSLDSYFTLGSIFQRKLLFMFLGFPRRPKTVLTMWWQRATEV